LAAYYLPNAEKVHKVSIIPRGLAIQDYTRPDGDHHLLTKDQLLSRIQVLLAGSVAEEMVFGGGSTSAKNDLERATEIARSMIMDYGLSKLGRVAYRENYGVYFTGNEEYGCNRTHSEQTAREIDEEIRSIINSSMETVRQLLERHQRALAVLAERLMEREVISAAELKEAAEADLLDNAAAKDQTKESGPLPFIPDSSSSYPHEASLPCNR
jgi:cell division protease FtsH